MKLALGTAQFGLDYGVANTTGRVSAGDVVAILNFAREAGIDTLDTAAAYGDSEAALGGAGIEGWKVVTKLPPAPGDLKDAGAWVRGQLSASLEKLGVSTVYGYLLHRPELLADHGPAIADALLEAKAEGLISRVGVSIYDPEQLPPAMKHFNLDLVQAPLNLIDRRIAETGWAARLRAEGTELHTRSSFLQGLLLMNADNRPPYFSRWSTILDRWRSWLEQAGVSPTAACLEFACSVVEVDRVVVGVDSLRQLEMLVRDVAGTGRSSPNWPEIQTGDPDLINPARWSLN